MTKNLLKLDDDKTELIVITTHSNTSQNQYIGINIGDSLITPSSEPPRNLGVLFDSTCSLNDHASRILKNINYNLYSIPSGKFENTFPKKVNCSITSRLVYCNSLLLYGTKGYNISQLKLCENNAAQMLSLFPKFDHITQVKSTLVACWAKSENKRCCCSLIKLFMVKLLHISPSTVVVFVYSNQAPATRDHKSPQSIKMPFGRIC